MPNCPTLTVDESSYRLNSSYNHILNRTEDKGHPNSHYLAEIHTFFQVNISSQRRSRTQTNFAKFC